MPLLVTAVLVTLSLQFQDPIGEADVFWDETAVVATPGAVDDEPLLWIETALEIFNQGFGGLRWSWLRCIQPFPADRFHRHGVDFENATVSLPPFEMELARRLGRGGGEVHVIVAPVTVIDLHMMELLTHLDSDCWCAVGGPRPHRQPVCA